MTNPEIVDVHFDLAGQRVPEDHADLLWQALAAALPWLAAEPWAAVHPLSGLSPGAACWYLSRRARLILRLPAGRVAEAQALGGATLVLGEDRLQVGAAAVRELQAVPVLYARFVAYGGTSEQPIGEEAFHAACRAELAQLGLAPRLLCGKARRCRTAAGWLSGFSLMLLDLDEAGNLLIQRRGLGEARKHGCGVFVPHKSGTLLE
ncbi:MAG: type I-MYXAN CRISPR-associated protein Cas6/Cmx6 [Rhodocyclaceae bacterium]|nr:type I-MYXAN CRISPR-associated protein Cas6/Cmx6 [Rhodocyclaceae bacterium]